MTLLLDSSALVAFVTAESEARAIFQTLVAAGSCAVGAPTLLETAMVLSRRPTGGSQGAGFDLALVLARFEVAVLPFGQEHWLVAWAAFLRYGKGRHPAGLNFGDCLTYAVARLSALPLLCLGGYFAKTDLRLVPLGG
jgi:ribonuclease VapC